MKATASRRHSQAQELTRREAAAEEAARKAKAKAEEREAEAKAKAEAIAARRREAKAKSKHWRSAATTVARLAGSRLQPASRRSRCRTWATSGCGRRR